MRRGRPAFTEQPVRPSCECGRPCTPNYRSKNGYILYKSVCTVCHKKRPGGEFSYRKKKKPHCEQCGFVAVHRCQLDVHHVDGDHTNNREENLRTLCANCHRLHHLGAA